MSPIVQATTSADSEFCAQHRLELGHDAATEQLLEVDVAEHIVPRRDDSERGAVGRVPLLQHEGKFVADRVVQRLHVLVCKEHQRDLEIAERTEHSAPERTLSQGWIQV
mgnify:CR=1 FL=1